jgi:methylenetetrahydrofolate/methylenetetrahydromethanopterin dehydrogenase (NADP+)
MSKSRILVQLDTDAQASVFDSVVAIDAGVEHLLRYADVLPSNVRERVHGAIFTRGPDDLRHTALFVGGSDVAAGEDVLTEILRSFLGPLRTSVMIDSGGANTTAAAAVLAAARHVDLDGATALVLASTGPVGQRVVRLLARQGAAVRAGSRNQDRARAVCEAVAKQVDGARVTAHATHNEEQTAAALQGVQLVFAAGAAGIELLSDATRASATHLKVAIDLNAVPPLGIAGLEVTDKAVERGGVICYGAIGVGGAKMKIHRAAVQALFESNARVLDAEEIFEIGRKL